LCPDDTLLNDIQYILDSPLSLMTTSVLFVKLFTQDHTFNNTQLKYNWKAVTTIKSRPIYI